MKTFRILPEPPEDSELARWVTEGVYREPSHSNFLQVVSPDEAYALTVQIDDPVHGYLIELYAHNRDRGEPIGRTIVDRDRDHALQTAAEMVAAATDLDALIDAPTVGPRKVYEEDVERGTIDPPDDWNKYEWEDALDEAFEQAEVKPSKATLTEKTIDGRDYYYLQWRDGDKVRSQYVGPVTPAS